jgi:prepilin-type N-terminal cleavage/methylation domain-containing protein
MQRDIRNHPRRSVQPRGFTLIELLVVIAIIAILAVVVVLTLNPAQLLAQSRDANRVSDMATLNSAVSLFLTDTGGKIALGNASSVYLSVPDAIVANTTSSCGGLSLPSSTYGYICGATQGFRNR